MLFDVETEWICALFLCACRLGTILVATPLLDGFGVPMRIKVYLVLALSLALVGSLGLAHATLPADLPGLLMAAATEVAVGGLMALGVFTAFGAIAFAGRALDIQIGFGVANVFDPVSRTQSPLLGSAFGILAVVMFFISDTHHLLLRGLAYSYVRIPPGALAGAATLEPVARQFGQVFSLGLLFAAPVVFCLFLLDIGLAVISRNLPQMNIFVISVPVKIVASFCTLGVLARHFSTVLDRVFGSIFQFWEAIL